MRIVLQQSTMSLDVTLQYKVLRTGANIFIIISKYLSWFVNWDWNTIFSQQTSKTIHKSHKNHQILMY